MNCSLRKMRERRAYHDVLYFFGQDPQRQDHGTVVDGDQKGSVSTIQ